MKEIVVLKDNNYQMGMLFFLTSLGCTFKIIKRFIALEDMTMLQIILLFILNLFVAALITALVSKKREFKIDDECNLVYTTSHFGKIETKTYKKELIEKFFYKSTRHGLYLNMYYKESDMPINLTPESSETKFLILIAILCRYYPGVSADLINKKVEYFIQTGKIKHNFFDWILIILLILVVLMCIGGMIVSFIR